MKKLKLGDRLRRWFYNDILNSYLNDFHPTFLYVADKISVDGGKFKNGNTEKEYRRIMKTLQSQKFQKLFYRVAEIKLEKELNLTKETKLSPLNVFIGKLKKFVAKTYLRFFDKTLYDSLLRFKLLSGTFENLNEKADKYMADTTLDERADRAVALGIVKENKGEAQKRLRNIQKIRTNAIYELNKVEL